MTPARLRELLGRVARGELDAEAAIEELSTLPFSEVESALVDSHREIRTGIPEVVFGQGKTPEQTVAAILRGDYDAVPEERCYMRGGLSEPRAPGIRP